MIPPGSSSITPRSSTFLSSPKALALGAPSRGYKDTCCPIQASSLGTSVTAFSSPQTTCPILPEKPFPREPGGGLPLVYSETSSTYRHDKVLRGPPTLLSPFLAF